MLGTVENRYPKIIWAVSEAPLTHPPLCPAPFRKTRTEYSLISIVACLPCGVYIPSAADMAAYKALPTQQGNRRPCTSHALIELGEGKRERARSCEDNERTSDEPSNEKAPEDPSAALEAVAAIAVALISTCVARKIQATGRFHRRNQEIGGPPFCKSCKGCRAHSGFLRRWEEGGKGGGSKTGVRARTAGKKIKAINK